LFFTGRRWGRGSRIQRLHSAFSRRYGNRPLQEIAASDERQFLDVPQTGPTAWRRKHGVLRDFFNCWQRRGKLNAVPIPPPLASTRRPSFVYLLPSGACSLLDAVPCCQRHAACRTSAITLQTLALFLYGTGMRVGEGLRRRLTDVDLDYDVITIRGTSTGAARAARAYKHCRTSIYPGCFAELRARGRWH
jgi:integrase